MNISRIEYPRPDFVREKWFNLNGEWEFAFDGTYHFGNDQRFLNMHPFPKKINVPFPYQSRLSGIGLTEIQPCLWYRRYFDLPDDFKEERVLLHFGAVDYIAKVWLNGRLLGEHRGGHVPFSFEITEDVQRKDNELVVKVIDTTDRTQPRGKQSWAAPTEVWYTQTSGIWQTVWLEAVPAEYIEKIKLTPDLDNGYIYMTCRVNNPQPGLILDVKAYYNGEMAGYAEHTADYPTTMISMQLNIVRPWSPEQPDLYDLVIRLRRDTQIVDEVNSYFGIRKISVKGKEIYLNNKPYFQRLVLDQGYWPDGLLTAPSDEALKEDIIWGKKLGFNGCRKHMKVEDPRFVYWADKLGYLVWSEFPACYEFNEEAQGKFLLEWIEAMDRDYNHPCIVVWVPYNESWGVKGLKNDPKVQNWVREIVKITRSIDPTRLVIDNDGWDHIDSDIYGYHDYAADGRKLLCNYNKIIVAAQGEESKPVEDVPDMMADGYKLPDKPVMLTEFGGVGFIAGDVPPDSWGYAGIPKTKEEFLERYKSLIKAANSLPGCCGFVYTELTDVECEINGLITYDRKPKFDIDEVNINKIIQEK